MWSLMERGGPLMWPLLLCSLVSMTVVIERFIFWCRQGRARDPALRNAVLAKTSHGLWDEALQLGSKSKDSLIRVISSGLAHRDLGMQNALEIAAADCIDRMKRGLAILDTVITVAPLLGILGTVMGIIQSFDLLGRMGVEDPQGVTAGIAQALITTAAGLTIAIFTVLAFNYFQARLSRNVHEMEKYINSLEIVHSKGQLVVENGSRDAQAGVRPPLPQNPMGIRL